MTGCVKGTTDGDSGEGDGTSLASLGGVSGGDSSLICNALGSERN